MGTVFLLEEVLKGDRWQFDEDLRVDIESDETSSVEEYRWVA
jgi:hypothetical protein